MNNKKQKHAEGNVSGKINRIEEGTFIQGEINSDSNFRVDGKINGLMKINGKLVLGTKGCIEGDVICESAEIEGSFNGTLQVKNFLSLKSTARVYGEIYTKKMAVEPGAEFTGKCAMGEQSSKPKGVSITQDAEKKVQELMEN